MEFLLPEDVATIFPKTNEFANRFLASKLIAVNLARFHSGGGGMSRQYYQQEDIASDAVTKKADLHDKLRSNLNLKLQIRLLLP